METKVKAKVVIMYPNSENITLILTHRQKHNVKLQKCFDL